LIRRGPSISGTNFGKAAADYGSYRAGFPESLFVRLAAFDVGLPQQTVIDLGTGTGTLARGFAIRGCNVIGVDADPRMMAQAAQLDHESKVSVKYVEARAEATGLDAGTADVVTAGQCWHWFDRPRAIAEVVRILRHGGKIVIAHFDWLPLSGNMVEATEQLIKRHNPDWDWDGGIGMHPQWLPELGAAKIQNLESFSYDVNVPYTPEAWRGRIRASVGVASLEEDSVRHFDADLQKLLSTRFPSSTLAVPHRVFAIVGEAPSE
jgi:SAM-dependent methyltransferase